ncbi:thioesterase domain-containing protein [Falsiroseomonas sp. HW251]|uniref:tetratricopeptide repeat protein n=1 Tax=Falsiroseomonas sp. HW251 TaxID=3390998 RepID=UPI003D30F107
MPDNQRSGGATARPGPRQQIAAIFARLLEREGVPHDAHFADLGGDSIQVLTLLLEIEERFGLSLTPPQFADHGTVEALAALVRARRAPQRLTAVQAGRGVPLFLAHAVNGVTPYAGWLAELLGPAQELRLMQWRLPPPGVPTLEEHAAGFAAAIRSAWPDGPYHIAGHSFGAMLAFEVARQIAEGGGQVAFLGLIDRGPSLHARRAGTALLPAPERRTVPTCSRMMERYVPQPYRGDLWLFRSGTPGENDLLAPAMGWGDLVLGRVHEIQAEGTHGGMMARDVLARWAPSLRRALDEAAPGTVAEAPRAGVTAGLEGLRAARRGDQASEIAAYRAAIAEAPLAPYWVWRNLAEALREAGDIEGAREALEGAARAEARPINACMDLAGLLQRRRPEEAARWAARARALGDGSVPAEIALGRLALQEGDAALAELHFRRVLEACPLHDRIARRLQLMFDRQGRLAEALGMAQQVARLRPGELAPLLEVARLAARCGDDAARIAAAQSALALAPAHEEARQLAA